MRFLSLFLLSSITYCCVQAELIDDLIEIVLHYPRGKELLKRAEEKEKSGNNGNDENPPLGNSPWKRENNKNSGTNPLSSSNIKYNRPTFMKNNYGHTGWRGGKKREADMESLLERIMVKDHGVPRNAPRATRDGTKVANTKGEELYKRLMGDINDLIIMQNKVRKGQIARKDVSSKTSLKFHV